VIFSETNAAPTMIWFIFCDGSEIYKVTIVAGSGDFAMIKTDVMLANDLSY
jgi:hypothetical protein